MVLAGLHSTCSFWVVRLTVFVEFAGIVTFIIGKFVVVFAGSEIVTFAAWLKDVILIYMGWSPWPAVTSGAANQKSVFVWPVSSTGNKSDRIRKCSRFNFKAWNKSL